MSDNVLPCKNETPRARCLDCGGGETLHVEITKHWTSTSTSTTITTTTTSTTTAITITITIDVNIHININNNTNTTNNTNEHNNDAWTAVVGKPSRAKPRRHLGPRNMVYDIWQKYMYVYGSYIYIYIYIYIRLAIPWCEAPHSENWTKMQKSRTNDKHLFLLNSGNLNL